MSGFAAAEIKLKIVLTDKIEAEAEAYFIEIDKRGGVLRFHRSLPVFAW